MRSALTQPCREPCELKTVTSSTRGRWHDHPTLSFSIQARHRHAYSTSPGGPVGRPPVAAANPAFTRSRMMPRSNSATTAVPPAHALPDEKPAGRRRACGHRDEWLWERFARMSANLLRRIPPSAFRKPIKAPLTFAAASFNPGMQTTLRFAPAYLHSFFRRHRL